ncbi:hypothetical protein BGZ82_008030 [Podila clonocystis]|nr:hypothetical protein BGZ82_008030 [Podila clonocystis]
MAPSVCDASIESTEAKGDPKLLASTNPDPLLHSAPSTISKDNDQKEDISTATHHAQAEKVDAMETQKASSIKRAMRLSGIPMPCLPPPPVLPTELEDFQINYSNNSSTIHTGVFSQQLDAYLVSLREDYQRQLQGYESLQAIVKEDPYFSATMVAELDAQDEDPFTLDSFENLMRMHAAKGKDFILARVTTQDPNDESKHYHSYYSAHQINKVLFRTQPDEGLLHRMKARNPLNNMLVVGDVHYYIITAEAINAIKPLPVIRSSSASILSHSSRMSRCSKLAAKAIASQSASARSSPILGTDCSLFSRGASPTHFDSESPVSIIPSTMAQSVLMADQEELRRRQKANSPNAGAWRVQQAIVGLEYSLCFRVPARQTFPIAPSDPARRDPGTFTNPSSITRPCQCRGPSGTRIHFIKSTFHFFNAKSISIFSIFSKSEPPLPEPNDDVWPKAKKPKQHWFERLEHLEQ